MTCHKFGKRFFCSRASTTAMYLFFIACTKIALERQESEQDGEIERGRERDLDDITYMHKV